MLIIHPRKSFRLSSHIALSSVAANLHDPRATRDCRQEVAMTHTPSRNLIKPRAALALVTTVLLASAARAQGQSHALVLIAYVNAAGGSDLTTGKYAAALVQIKPGKRGFAYRGATTDTNLCVAYIAMRDLPAARTACAAAVTAEKAERVGLSVWNSNARTHPNPQLALADSNRAVLDDVLLDKAAAAAPEALPVRRNLEVLNMERPMREVRAQN
jgi:hypothetical protein